MNIARGPEKDAVVAERRSRPSTAGWAELRTTVQTARTGFVERCDLQALWLENVRITKPYASAELFRELIDE
jgi:hypothetical protein